MYMVFVLAHSPGMGVSSLEVVVISREPRLIHTLYVCAVVSLTQTILDPRTMPEIPPGLSPCMLTFILSISMQRIAYHSMS